MNGLVLFDLDNVAAGGLDLALESAELAQEKCEGITEWWVAFAMNTETPRRHDVSLEDLRQMGSALGAAQTEIALALPLPQTADVLVARLAQSAPMEATAGNYAAAVLVGVDGDLRRDLGRLYEAKRHGWLRSPGATTTTWRMSAAGRTVFRTPPGSAKTAKTPKDASAAPELEQAFTVSVDDHGKAAWATGRSVDIECMSLESLASHVDYEPWALSQLGATAGAMRGVARLSRFDEARAERLSLGEVHEQDGVEVRGTCTKPGFGGAPTRASVGAGAVRFTDVSATVRSLLPAHLLRELCAKGDVVRIGLNGVNVRSAVQSLRYDVPLGEVVEVVLSTRGSDLVAKVKHERASQPKAWWVLGESTTTSEVRIQGVAADLVPRRLEVSARFVRPSREVWAGEGSGGNDKVQLMLGSAVRRGASVVIQERIGRGEVGRGLALATKGSTKMSSKTKVGVFAPDRPLEAGETLCVEPAHSSRCRKLPEALRSLPLVVPL